MPLLALEFQRLQRQSARGRFAGIRRRMSAGLRRACREHLEEDGRVGCMLYCTHDRLRQCRSCCKSAAAPGKRGQLSKVLMVCRGFLKASRADDAGWVAGMRVRW